METKKNGQLGLDAYGLLRNRLEAMLKKTAEIKAQNDNPNSHRLNALLRSVELCRDVIKSLHLATEIMVLTADKIDKSEHGTEFVLQSVNARKSSFKTHKDWEKEADALIDMVFNLIQSQK